MRCWRHIFCVVFQETHFDLVVINAGLIPSVGRQNKKLSTAQNWRWNNVKINLMSSSSSGILRYQKNTVVGVS